MAIPADDTTKKINLKSKPMNIPQLNVSDF